MKKIIFVLSLLLMVTFVSAQQLCMDTTQLCKDALFINGDVLCDIDDVVKCPSGCDKLLNQCKGSVPVPTCSEGYMQCGQLNVLDPNGDVFKCVGGQWKIQELCGSKTCVEQSVTRAFCQSTQYYCRNSNGLDCFSSSIKSSNCYNTISECQDSIILYCADDSSKVCTRRTGQCYDWEREVRGTDLDSVYASCMNSLDVGCKADTDCGFGLECVYVDENGDRLSLGQVSVKKACLATSQTVEPTAVNKFKAALVSFFGQAGEIIFFIIIGLLVFFGFRYIPYPVNVVVVLIMLLWGIIGVAGVSPLKLIFG